MNELKDDREWLNGQGAASAEYPAEAREAARAQSSVLREVYAWMGGGLALSGAVAWHAAQSGLCVSVVTSGWFLPLCLAEIGLVIALSFALEKLSAFAATAMFLGYAALNGLTLSTIFLVYDLGAIARTFFVTAGMFGAMALYGATTRRDLAGWGSFLVMGLFGVVIAGVANLFFKSAMLDFLVSCAGVVVFTGLAAWDAQKVRRFALAAAEHGLPAEETRKAGILFALSLYLDFVNLFLHLLRFMGGKRR